MDLALHYPEQHVSVRLIPMTLQWPLEPLTPFTARLVLPYPVLSQGARVVDELRVRSHALVVEQQTLSL